MKAFSQSLLALSLASVAVAAAACNTSALNTTTYNYYITVDGTTVFDVARATNRGVCDIGRQNLMADVTIVPNVGEYFIIPPEVCEPDNTSCLLPNINATRTCIYGGPRLYYTVRGDTYEVIARRLNITVESLMHVDGPANETLTNPTSPTAELDVGQFIKVPQCDPSQCVIQPYVFKWGVYKDLAEKYGTTVGQIMMMSPTYNYSSLAFSPEGMYPPINLPINCTALSNNMTTLD
ncbi:hypothetical protein ABZX51_000209 [Aspergillus tubingensis]|uniref:LysM domain-containing protein n=1 Tax=Aspergillus tubingensis (strain CBS 134.48) TaxID=767770 RepID=A0A1L9N6L4_ASPTC|nr:hypothetical protein ASPTUDRAFT_199998 [Aspergillus tubingensis CBS 134.48]GLB06422.1 hypothetical protein AtubIFM57258_001728 [Aspergillus tubingensis]